MQFFKDTDTGAVYGYDDGVIVTITEGVAVVEAIQNTYVEDGEGNPLLIQKKVTIDAPRHLASCDEPTTPELTLGENAFLALNAGLQISFSSAPDLNGTYAIDVTAQAKIAATELYISKRGAFYGGTATYPWIDISGTAHTFTLAQFDAFSIAVADYVAGLYAVIDGHATELPANPVNST